MAVAAVAGEKVHGELFCVKRAETLKSTMENAFMIHKVGDQPLGLGVKVTFQLMRRKCIS